MIFIRYRSILSILSLSLSPLVCAQPAMTVAAAVAATEASPGRVITVLYVGAGDSDAAAGARQGMEEGKLQGLFLDFTGRLVERETVPEASSAAGMDAVVTDLPAEDVLNLIHSLPPDIPVINMTAGDDALREGCHGNLLHTIPADGMLAAAAAAWQKTPNAGQAVAWHPDFRKFAARDLNKRYKAAQGQPMNSAAWAGWAATRSLTDAYARGGADAIRALARTDRGGFAFDGQKGHDMSYLPNGQLRQVILIQDDGELSGEAPGVYPAGEPDISHCQ